jgi:DNA-binding NarL/FixJ family response regulator
VSSSARPRQHVAIADDEVLVRTGFRVILQSEEDFEVVGEAENGTLSGRELEVVALMARELSNAELAEALHLGQTTVKSHVGRVLSKLDVRDRVQAVVLAYETGLVEPARGDSSARG